MSYCVYRLLDRQGNVVYIGSGAYADGKIKRARVHAERVNAACCGPVEHHRKSLYYWLAKSWGPVRSAADITGLTLVCATRDDAYAAEAAEIKRYDALHPGVLFNKSGVARVRVEGPDGLRWEGRTFEDYWAEHGLRSDEVLGLSYREVAEKAWNAGAVAYAPKSLRS